MYLPKHFFQALKVLSYFYFPKNIVFEDSDSSLTDTSVACSVPFSLFLPVFY